MPYHVDQSGKIEHGRGPTVLALANDSAYTLCISAREKRLATRTLQVHYDRKAVTVWLFAAALYYVLIELPRGATSRPCYSRGCSRKDQTLLLTTSCLGWSGRNPGHTSTPWPFARVKPKRIEY